MEPIIITLQLLKASRCCNWLLSQGFNAKLICYLASIRTKRTYCRRMMKRPFTSIWQLWSTKGNSSTHDVENIRLKKDFFWKRKCFQAITARLGKQVGGWQAARSQYHHHFIRLALHNGNVRIYQQANVAVIPTGRRYIWHIRKPLARFMDI